MISQLTSPFPLVPPRPRSKKEVRVENMFAALNDCLYRTMYRYRYALLVDVDEYIVPRQHADYPAMFELLAGHGRRDYGSFIFKVSSRRSQSEL